jgi:serine/threonine protein kinase/Tfp pilus assembly protein PilF
MIPQSSEHENLSLEDVARVDAACDRFEAAWKAVLTGSPAPQIETFLDHCSATARAALQRELMALDCDCRNRYGNSARKAVGGSSYPAPDFSSISQTRLPTPVGSSAPRKRVHWPRLPGLELVEILGSGGMGVVFKARQATLGRAVAVKLLRDIHLEGSAHHERFMQEARAVARLQHANLVQLYEFGEIPSEAGDTARPYLVLEYVSGGSLADLVRGSPQPPAEAARLVELLAEAIHYAHLQGVIHRDLKPANVLLRGEGKESRGGKQLSPASRASRLSPLASPAITDFGLAKFQAGTELTRTGEVVGTPSYMAPEQAAGKAAGVTAAVDVYGLGAILYEALTGRPPFEGDSTIATLLLVKHEEPVPPRRLQPSVPCDLETICLKCLRKEPGHRYATAEDLADDLRRFRADESIRARPASSGEKLVRWCRRKPLVAGLAAALALVFLSGLSGVLWQWQSARENAAESQRNAEAFRTQWERAEFHLQNVEQIADRLTRLGLELGQRPGHSDTSKAVLEEALGVYRQLLPEEASDRQVRIKAANLHGRVAQIHHTLGQWEEAANAYGNQADLLSEALADDPANQRYGNALATSHRWRGNVLRDLGRAQEAIGAYEQAVELHERLLKESPDNPRAQSALSNSLLNQASVFVGRKDRAELERLYERILELNRAASAAAPDYLPYQEELALGLEAKGWFLMQVERSSQAVKLLGDALTIRRSLLAGGRMPADFQRYFARNLADLGRAQAADGQFESAEHSYREAMKLLGQSARQFPYNFFYVVNLAETAASLADLLQSRQRWRDAEEIRRCAVSHYETLMANFPNNSGNLHGLVKNYTSLAEVVWELGRYAEAAELYRKALTRDPESPTANNSLAWYLATASDTAVRNAAEAVRLAQKAVAADPNAGTFWNTLGAAHYRLKDYKAAITDLESSMRLRDGGDSYDWFFLAMANGHLGDQKKARHWFDRAVAWTDKHKPMDDELRRIRAEAGSLLALPGK